MAPFFYRLAASYYFAVFLALMVHALLATLLIGWSEQAQQHTYVQPKAIKASLVQIEKPKPKKKPAPPKKEKPRPVEKTVTKPKPKQIAPEKEVIPLEKNKSKKVEEVIPEEPSIEESLDEWLAEDASEIQAEEDLTEIQRYSLAIENQVYRRWSRPPSARNNMVVLLGLRLLPSGDIVSVTVLEGSGNDALDRSAVSAVKRVQRFEFIREMEPRLFEAYFREFEMRFSPQDMRL